MRDAFVDSVIDLAEKDDRVVMLDADLSICVNSGSFQEKYPDRFWDAAIAEQHHSDIVKEVQSVKVDMKRLDRLMDLVGELRVRPARSFERVVGTSQQPLGRIFEMGIQVNTAVRVSDHILLAVIFRHAGADDGAVLGLDVNVGIIRKARRPGEV